MKKLICTTLLLITSIFFVIGCGKNSIEVPKPDFETQKVSEDNFEFEIPTTWEKADISLTSGQYVYTTKDANLESGTSNVSIIISETSEKTIKMEDAKTELESQIKTTFGDNVTNIKTNSLKASCGDVCVGNYDLSISGINMSQTLYYPLIDNYNVTITSTNINDNTTPSPEDVAKHIINTFTLK